MERAIRIRRIAKWSGLAVCVLLPTPILAGLLNGGKLAIWVVFFFTLWFTLFVCFGLVVACALMSLATNMLTLVVALFCLRLFGQGLMSHTANTAAARYFDHLRGRALSFVNLGHPAGEAVLPVLTVALLASLEWRTCWQLCGLVVRVRSQSFELA